MRTSLNFVCAMFGLAVFCFPAYSQSSEAERKTELSACTGCHSLRLIDSQRLSVAAWGKEVNKMMGWGASVPDRQLLIDYLSSQYSDAKPIPVPPLTGNGVAPDVSSSPK
jgi:hypothetical protein